ncbi:hypothetical protein DFP72DRAFT_1060721 [Ephemerocybe angulata]|uniref:Response regulatory domain-containing protein n=1 Tax=Ephemerocybe angulata TaxID=980116 RepID=A0A8H6IBH5_9AGAR|nr:hypothetical protein DFP72DRAFT_1060721 [Tulosesus angulatus]
MSANAGPQLPKLPALRLTPNGECVIEDAVPLDVPQNSNGFSVSYAQTGKAVPWVASSSSGGVAATAASLAALDAQNQVSRSNSSSRMENGTSEVEEESSAGGGGGGLTGGFEHQMGPETSFGPLSTRSEIPPQLNEKQISPSPPRFSRAATMPLPSQLNQLLHPHRTQRSASFWGPNAPDTLEEVGGSSASGRATPTASTSSPSFSASGSGYESPHVRELSYELADSIQMVVQTLLQISPAQVLDPGKEQFTACALSIPTSSMSAMFTVMKNINYLSANMSSYFGEDAFSRLPGTPDGTLPPLPPSPGLERIEFDIGETLQAVGDSLSGCAAQAGVDLVLYHGDVSLKHVSVYGDEASLRYAITQVIQQVLNTAERGDSVELGLFMTPVTGSEGDTQGYFLTPPEHGEPSNNGGDPQIPRPSDIELQCMIRISHKFASPERGEADPYGPEPEQTRPSPNLSTISIRQILRHTSSILKKDLPPPPTFPMGRTIELEFPLRRARSSFLTPGAHGLLGTASPTVATFAAASNTVSDGDGYIQRDASLPHLIEFAETLKGKKVTLYASAKGSFAQHLTSYLTAWGMIVSHVTPEGTVDGVTDLPSAPLDAELPPGSNAILAALVGKLEASKMNGLGVPEVDGRKPMSFIFIDDDIEILKERLHALRADQAPASFLHSMKRPPLSSLHRPRSTTHIPTTANPAPAPPPLTPNVVVLHFTSLSNYKHLRESVQTIISTYAGTNVPVPEVMIIPKPAGPRRFLAALFTAVTKPPVDPQFVPIATSPMSPGVNGQPFFFPPPPPPTAASEPSPKPSTKSPPLSPSLRPIGSRTNSDRSMKSSMSIEAPPHIPPSPLTIPDNIEYFSAAAHKLGTTPSSGFVIQSPDGQPAGILFRPNLKGKSTGRSSSRVRPPSMERGGTDQQTMKPPMIRRDSSRRNTQSSGMLDFRALHAASSAVTSPSGDPPSTVSPVSATSISPSTSGGSGSSVPPPIQVSTSTPAPSSEKASSPMTPNKAAIALASGSTSIPGTTTRKSSLGPKPTSPPGSPKTDGKSWTSRKMTANDSRESSTTPRANNTNAPSNTGSSSSLAFKKGKVSESNIIPPISVLVVDDNPINQTILSTFMRKKKIKYDIANNGAEAVAKWKTGGFHLILMDIQMPIMDGIEATKEIRRLEKLGSSSGFPQLTPTIEGQRTPSDVSTADSRSAASPYRSSVIIVALTASSLQSDRVAALAAGCNDFLTKPVSLLWLNNKIIEWGSIKALQMWADLRPDVVRSMNTGQAQQARAVAENLHMPRTLLRKRTPSPKRSSSLKEEQDAAIALASPSGGGMIPQAVQKAIATAELNAAVQAEAARSAAVASATSLARSNSKLSRTSSRRASTSPEAVESRLPPRVRRVSVDVDSERDHEYRSASPSSSSYFTPVAGSPASSSQEDIASTKTDDAPVVVPDSENQR